MSDDSTDPYDPTDEFGNFETAEVGDWFERERGVADHYKVVEIEETFGDRVSIVLETRSASTKTDDETARRRVNEGEFEREFQAIEDPTAGEADA
jgi:hypothetical protein